MSKLEWKGTIPYDDLARAIKEISYACDPGDTRFCIDHILFDGKHQRIVATNGIQLAAVKCEWMPAYEFLVSFQEAVILRTRFMGEGDTLTLSLYGTVKKTSKMISRAVFCIGSDKLKIEIKANGYPDYRSVIGEITPNWLIIDKKSWVGILKEIASKYKKDKKDKNRWTIIDPKQTKAVIRAKFLDIQYEVDIESRGQPSLFHVNAERFQKSLSAIRSKRIWINQRKRRKSQPVEPPLLLLDSSDSGRESWETIKKIHLLYPLIPPEGK